VRDDFPIAVKEILAKRVGNRCSNPECRQPTSGPQEDPTKAVNIGVAAHITAASPDGPRYDESLTAEQRRSHANGIWLCQNHGKLVDNDSVKYSPALLREWKRIAEQLATLELEGPKRVASDRLAPFAKAEGLMPLLISEMRQDLVANPLTREFIVFKRAWSYNGQATAYYYDDHPDLDDKMRVLENLGLIRDVTYNNVKRYRMSESFAEYLCATSSKQA
jgi:hypothetical protein